MSESPGEESGPGVLGRIGSWFSPWKTPVPKDPENENATPTNEKPHGPGLDRGKIERTEAGSETPARREGTRIRSADPERLRPSRDIFSSEKEDATQSNHRGGPFLLSGWEPAERGPKEEEFLDAREFLEGRRGQERERERRREREREREGGSIGTPLTGVPASENKAGRLTPLSGARAKGVAGKADSLHTPAQRKAHNQAGKKLHVYLEEESSVLSSGNDSGAGNEVVRTRLEKSFNVIAKTKSLDTLDPPRISRPLQRGNRTGRGSAQGLLSSSLEQVSAAPSDTLREYPEPPSEEADSNSMGRKNSNRRKSRKQSQGEVEGSPRESTPSMGHDTTGSPSAAGSTLSAGAQSIGVEAHLAAGSPASAQSLSEGGRNKTSPKAIERETARSKQSKGYQGTDSTGPTDASGAVVEGVAADMEDEYKLERKTETPESKRKSIKVSRSEVKIFPKKFLVNADPQSRPISGNISENFRSGLLKPQDAVKDISKTEDFGGKQNLGKLDEEKPLISGRIADRISAFEGQRVGVVKNFHTPRSADVSPSRAATSALKGHIIDAVNRSKSVERIGDGRPGSAPPLREKANTVKERAGKIEACKSEDKSPVSPKPAMPRMSLKTTSGVTLRAVAKPSQQDIQDKLAINQRTPSLVISEIRPKQDVIDGTINAVTQFGREQTDSGTKYPKQSTVEVKNLLTTPNSAGTDRAALVDSAEPANDTNPEARTLSKAGFPSKKRRGRDSASSPDGKKSDESNDKPLLTSSQQEKSSATMGLSSPQQTLPAPGKFKSASTSGDTSLGEKHPVTKPAHQPSGKTIESSDKEPASNDDGLNQSLKGKGGLSVSVTANEGPDTAIAPHRATQPANSGSLPMKTEKHEGHIQLSDRKGPKVSKGISKALPSPEATMVEQPLIEKPLPAGQSAPAVLVKSEKSSRLVDGKAKGSVKQQVAKTETIHPSEEKRKTKNDTPNVSHAKDDATDTTKQQQQKLQPISMDNVTPKGAALNGRETTKAKEDSKPEAGIKGGDKPAENTSNLEPNQSEATNKASPAKQAVITPALVTIVLPTQDGGTNDSALSVSDLEIGRVKLSELQRTTNESKKNSIAKATDKMTKTALTTEELQSECLSVGKTATSTDDSHPREAGVCVAQEAFGSNQPLKSGTVGKTVPAKTKTLEGKNLEGGKKKKPIISARDPTSPHIALPKPIGQVVVEKLAGNKSLTNSFSTTSMESLQKIKTDPAPPDQLNDSQKPQQTVNIADSAAPPQEVAPTSRDIQIIVPNISNTNETETVDKHFMRGGHPSLVVTDDIVPKLQPVDKDPGPALFGPDTPKASAGKGNMESGSPHRSPQSRLSLSRGLSGGDLSPQRDAPSSWLDVDFPKERLKLPDQPPRLCSSSSESNLLDTMGELGDDDFVEKIKKLCAPFSLPPRKHSYLRQPQPPFALPAIREDRFEKTFDPDEFKFGLRKKTVNSGPSLLANFQKNETKANLKPARASIADRCSLLATMDTRSWLRERASTHDEKDEGEEEVSTTKVMEKEEKKEEPKVRSRLEGSSILSSLCASSARGHRTGLEALPHSGVASPSNGPHTCQSPGASTPALPSSTSPASLAETLDSHHPVSLAGSSKIQAWEAVVAESAPQLPSFNDIKLPSDLEKHLPQVLDKPEPSKAGKEQANIEQKPGVLSSSAVLDVATEIDKNSGKMLPTMPSPPSRVPPPRLQLHPHGVHSADIEVPKGPHRRPGKMVLFENTPFSGQAYEVFRDVEDATAFQLSPTISVRVVRGCWILYERPGFQGRSIALEEGCLELTNVWAPPHTGAGPHKDPDMLIGSIRLAVCDYTLPHIDLFTEPEGHGRVTPYHDDTIETGSFGIAQSTASIKVHSGVWLVFSDPGYQGMLAVLESGEYPVPESWGFPSPFIGSLRPLKMGAFKVENPNEVKAVLYEKAGFQGPSAEVDSDLLCFEEDEEEEGKALNSTKLKSVGSLKITGGLWVGYSQPGFEGRQHVLEEGEYLDWMDWGGGTERFLSLRPVLADFISPNLKMFPDKDFGPRGADINLTIPVPSMELTGYGLRTHCVDVIGGVWVVFEQPDFSGESYVLEKGLYGSPEDWGGLQPLVASVMPVVLDNLENTAKFKVHLFSEADFQGSDVVLEDSADELQADFSAVSCRVLAGSWLAFEGPGFTGRMYALEMGSYSDLRAMGCVHSDAAILSLQTTGFAFSLPSVTVFERPALRGKRVVLTTGSVNLQLAGGCSRVQSVLVEGGMWVLYKEINYRGNQILLKPGEILDWRSYSSWNNIGSLRPLIQKQVYIRLRNRQSGLLMSVTGELEDIKLMRVQETEETGGAEQVWLYQDGHLRCKIMEECFLCPSGSMIMSGSRLGLAPEPEGLQPLWSIGPDGVIHHMGPAGLLLDVKGGHNYDKNQVILNNPSKPTQCWDVEIL